MMKALKFASLMIIISSAQSFAWDGTNMNTGDPVEIERGNLVREGEDIEFFDYGTGTYRFGTVENVDRFGGSVNVDVYDYNTGEPLTLEMDE